MIDLTQEQIALKYAEHGICVFPCHPETKVPLTKGGFTVSSTDKTQIEGWWKRHPNALIGHPCNDVVVVDVDIHKHGRHVEKVMSDVLDDIQEKLSGQKTMAVETLSGGRHYYFKNVNETRRRTKRIAEVDVLGINGYTILPDGKSYVSDTDTPWVSMNELSDFDDQWLESMVEKHKDVSDFLKNVLAGLKFKATSLTPKKNKTAEEKKKFNSDTEKFQKVEEELRESGVEGINMGIINYETNKVEFRIERGMYKGTDSDFEKADSTKSLLVDGKLTPAEGELNTDQINQLFHNHEIQSKLADLIGIPTPAVGSTESIRSILPNHLDENRSMGVRWSKDGSHIIVRDFANHFGDVHEQVDYNLVRLYCTLRYNTNVPRMNGPEFNIWFMRMMHEAGILDVTHLIQPTKSVSKLHKTQVGVLQDYQLLDALKRTYDGYDGTSTFADKFSSAWCQLTPSTINRSKKALVRSGHLEVVGMYDCSGGKRDDGFFNTKLYKIPSPSKGDDKPTGVKEKMLLNEAVKLSTSVSANKAEKETQERYPDLGTLVRLQVDEKDVKEIENFTIDFAIPNMPDDGNIAVPLYVADKYEVMDIEQENKTYVMDNFVLDIFETSDGKNALAVVGKSPPISEIIEKANSDEDNPLIDETEPYFIISYDLEDTEVDLDELTIKFNEYVSGRVTLTSVETIYRHTDDIAALLDGRDMDD